jgi:hypothetical protein
VADRVDVQPALRVAPRQGEACQSAAFDGGQAAVELKVLIEQMREQVQNVE